MSLMSLKGGPADVLIGDGLHATIIRLLLFLYFLRSAYNIRLHALEEYGLVIHEFDPWFNYRATEYLAQHGSEKFFKWYDYMSWYPLGRPVGTTIYPGMQITSVTIWNVLNGLGYEISLNDVCCYVPAWFGVSATFFLAALTYECSGSANASVAAAGIMAVVPAHIMRSVGGGYDNESVAVTAMCMTFFWWVRSLRSDGSWPIGIIAGISYIYMAAAWGGYIFVINMVAVHALGLVATGRYSNKLHHAYTLFYIVGTYGAMQVPVIGWTPLKSLEQLGALGVFCILQVMYYCEIQRVKDDLDSDALQALRLRIFGIAGAVGFVLVACIWPTGYFGPLSSRIRGLFVQHTRTGNPLVDSVAEHQPASTAAYWQYLHNVCYVGPIGFIACFHKKTDAKWFLIMYAMVAYYFSAKMVRLVLLLGPIGSALGGIAMANGAEWMLDQLADVIPGFEDAHFEDGDEPVAPSPKKSNRGSKRGGRGGDSDINDLYKDLCTSCRSSYDSPTGIQARKVGAIMCALMWAAWIPDFVWYSQEMAVGMSQPSIMFKGTLRNGQTIMVDDYREAYWWLRDNTAEDARVMAWWDYGYQISGIANRTTIADGNTWNHEHIATLGRCLTSPEKQAHRIVRHLADYVLVWTGGGGDDLAKSPHMARIGTSVYKDICPGDPTCSAFGFKDHQSMTPTPMMAESLLYKLHGHNQSPGVTVDPQRFREVFTSKYNKVRIFKVLKVSKESKNWVADPANRDCDAPGSWYCTGNYPPALHDLINQRKNFKQLEDFNVERDEEDEEHYQEYMRRMAGGGGEAEAGYQEAKTADAEKSKKRKERKEAERAAKKAAAAASSLPADADEAGDYDPDEDKETGAESKYEPPTGQEPPMEHSKEWADTPITTRMWSLIHGGKAEELFEWIQSDPSVVHVRAADGRGPLWWAYEYEQTDIQQLLLAAGVDPAEEDSDGNVAATMAP